VGLRIEGVDDLAAHLLVQLRGVDDRQLVVGRSWVAGDWIATMVLVRLVLVEGQVAVRERGGGAGTPLLLGHPSMPFARIMAKNPICRPLGSAAGLQVGKIGASPGDWFAAGRVYRKLGIRSRTQLARRFASDANLANVGQG
jgi:hypothetical protein